MKRLTLLVIVAFINGCGVNNCQVDMHSVDVYKQCRDRFTKIAVEGGEMDGKVIHDFSMRMCNDTVG